MSLNNLKTRISYHGGVRQVDRMIEDKEKSFKDSLWKSYQSATAILQDGREFRCLINPNKISMELDDKMLSIPFEDQCLTSQKLEEIKVKCGDIIEWKENGTHWIIYSQYLQEVAYFRGLMRQCSDDYLEIDGKKFWYYLKGPDDKSIDWQKTKHFIFNNLNYTIEIYISNTTETNKFFHRFKKLKIQGKPFEVQAVDNLSINGILTVYLKETYDNEWEQPQPNPDVLPNIPVEAPRIEGPDSVYPYDIVEYKILNASDGKWTLSNNRACITNINNISVTIEIISGKSGDFSLIYRTNGNPDIVKTIKILSL